MNIQINNLSQIYPGDKRALNDINLNIGSGLFGLLGPNGAGKTTLMRILVTLMKPTHGQVSINNLDLYKHRKQIRQMLGYLPQEFSTFPKIKTCEFLDYNARLAGIRSSKERNRAVDEMLEKVALDDVRDRSASKLSGGMKRRLGIAQALIGDPKILIVDEPTTGLDPEERIRFRNILADLGQEQRIIILSTHIVGDISSTCNNMALLLEGEVAFNGPPESLIAKARNHVFQIEVDDTALESIKEKYSIISTIPSEAGWKVQIVADHFNQFNAITIEPNLEHAYVYFVEIQEGIEIEAPELLQANQADQE
jgi:ABC-type multidrug transport system ATPase subunit